ncbi:MAG TPA: hypothetical protein VLJ86_10135 [Ramlibacter sp.]|nr:hypothetical protein [Ramlibacter sp.]
MALTLAPCLCLADVLADGPPPTMTTERSSACRPELTLADPLLLRTELLVLLQAQPESCLKAQFNECSQDAAQGLMGFREAAHCSLRYEALLAKTFRGDFGAFLAWWRGEQAR